MAFRLFRRLFGKTSNKITGDTSHQHADVVSRARDGQPIHDIADGIRAAETVKLADRHAALRDDRVEIETLDAEASAFSIEALKAEASAGADQIAAMGIGGAYELDALHVERAEASAGLKAYLDQRGLAPGQLQPLRVLPMLLISAFMLCEGLLTGSVFYHSGVVPTVAAGATLGVMASAAAVLLSALIGGHLIGRHFNLAVSAPVSNGPDTQKRIFARVSAPVVVGAIFILHGSLATARTEGTLDGALLAFLANPLAMFGTLDSMLLVAFGLGGSILAWSEGLSAFGDPDPGRERAYHRSIGSIKTAIDHCRTRCMDALDDAEEALLSRIDEAAEEVFGGTEGRAERVARFEADKAALADAVEDAIEAIHASHEGMIALYRSIAGKNPPDFGRIDPEAIRARFRFEWSPQGGAADHLEAEFEACRTVIITAAAEARRLITTSFHENPSKEDPS